MLSFRLRRHSFYKTLMWFIVLLVGVFFLGFLLFVRSVSLPSFQAKPVAEYTVGQYDAIVVVTGATGRLEEGLNLLNAGIAPKLFVSGVGWSMDVRQLLRLAKSTPKRLESSVFLGYKAQSTAQNARETQQWVQKHGIKTMLLVTSNYHMMRTALEFNHAMPIITIDQHAITSPRVHVDQWYKYPATGLLVAREYGKFLIIWVEKLLLNMVKGD